MRTPRRRRADDDEGSCACTCDKLVCTLTLFASLGLLLMVHATNSRLLPSLLGMARSLEEINDGRPAVRSYRADAVLPHTAAASGQQRILPSDILVATLYIHEGKFFYIPCGYDEAVSVNRAAYAAAHGYSHTVPARDPLPDLPPAWAKIVYLQRWLRLYPVVFLLDADALITNAARSVQSILAAHPSADIILTADANGINTGQMILRSTAWTLHVLQRMWEMRDVVGIDNPWWEQAALMKLLKSEADSMRGHIVALHQATINSYPYVSTAILQGVGPKSGVDKEWQPPLAADGGICEVLQAHSNATWQQLVAQWKDAVDVQLTARSPNTGKHVYWGSDLIDSAKCPRDVTGRSGIWRAGDFVVHFAGLKFGFRQEVSDLTPFLGEDWKGPCSGASELRLSTLSALAVALVTVTQLATRS